MVKGLAVKVIKQNRIYCKNPNEGRYFPFAGVDTDPWNGNKRSVRTTGNLIYAGIFVDGDGVESLEKLANEFGKDGWKFELRAIDPIVLVVHERTGLTVLNLKDGVNEKHPDFRRVMDILGKKNWDKTEAEIKADPEYRSLQLEARKTGIAF